MVEKGGGGKLQKKNARKIACFFFGGVKLGCFKWRSVSVFNLKPFEMLLKSWKNFVFVKVPGDASTL